MKSIVVYLKSPRRRRDKLLRAKCCEKYRCVPKIASPETRKKVKQHTTALYKVSFNIRNKLQRNTKRMVLREALGGAEQSPFHLQSAFTKLVAA